MGKDGDQALMFKEKAIPMVFNITKFSEDLLEDLMSLKEA